MKTGLKVASRNQVQEVANNAVLEDAGVGHLSVHRSVLLEAEILGALHRARRILVSRGHFYLICEARCGDMWLYFSYLGG